jgi:hypothetical protein
LSGYVGRAEAGDNEAAVRLFVERVVCREARSGNGLRGVPGYHFLAGALAEGPSVVT